MDDVTDEKILRRTFELAKFAGRQGCAPYGAILARGKTVLFEGENTVSDTNHDLSCHAEMNVLREASGKYEASDFAEMTLYCSGEPCAMCATAAYLYGIERVVFGAPGDQCPGGLKLPCRDVFARSEREIEVLGPLLLEEALAVFS